MLIVDDQKREESWGQITKIRLEELEFKVDHVYTVDESRAAIAKKYYDIFVIDLDLQSRETGADLQKELRGKGLRQPVILATGNKDYLSRPLSEYAEALSQGPVQFYDKTIGLDIVKVVKEVSNRVDPIRRSFRLMSEARLGDKIFRVDGKKYTVDELLASSLTSDDLVRTLRESLYALVLESQVDDQNGSKSD